MMVQKISSLFSRGQASDKSSEGTLSGDTVTSARTPLLKKDDTTYSLLDEFSSLPKREAEILRAQVEEQDYKANFLSLYRFASRTDRVLLVVAYVSAIFSGALRPLMPLFVGNIAQIFVTYRPPNVYGYPSFQNHSSSEISSSASSNNTSYGGNSTHFIDQDSYYSSSPEYFQDSVNRFVIYFVYLAIGDIVFSSIYTYLFIERGEIISSRIRENYLRAIMKQNIAFFDRLGSGEVTSRISSDTLLIQEGISEKMGQLTSNSTTVVVALIIAFSRSYRLAFILISITAVVFASMITCSRYMVKFTRKSLAGYSSGASIAEEIITNVRNVQAFGTEERLSNEYDRYLEVTEVWGHRSGMVLGAMIGILWLGTYNNYALAFWQGSHFIASYTAEIGEVVSVLMAMMMSSFFLSNVPPLLRVVNTAIAATSKVYKTVQRSSAIDSDSNSGIKDVPLAGNIELRDVKFIYPSRPSVTILNQYNLKISAGSNVALVGASGSGKSTIVGLLERFYSPVSGQILVDDVPIENYNLTWLRQQMSIVSQDPVLFSCSIYANVSYGLVGTPFENYSEPQKRDLVIEACKQANAWSFIKTFPDGLDTEVGERGFFMSGGQKQRIVIARAIISNPKILLLDEATSALDSTSESLVQEALDVISKNRTTITIAHRLSTIQNADQIIVMSKGQIKEIGKHAELLSRKGEYFNLVTAQTIAESEDAKKNAGKVSEKSSRSVTPTRSRSPSGSESTVSSDGTLIGYQADSEKSASKDHKESESFNSSLENGTSADESTLKLIAFIFKLSLLERRSMIAGITLAFITGLGHPIIAILYAKCVTAFRYGADDSDHMLRDIRLFSGMFVMVGFIMAGAFFLSNYYLSFIAQRLIHRIRFLTLKHLLRQEIAYFDAEDHSSGSLTNMLSSDAQAVEGISGSTLGQILQAGSNVFCGIALSLIVAPKMAAVFVACVPLMVACGYFRFSLLSKVQKQTQIVNEKSATYACEAAAAIRTIATLTRQGAVQDYYQTILQNQIRENWKFNARSSLLFGAAQGLQFLIMSLAFWYGSQFLKTGEYSTVQFYIAFMSTVFGSQAAGIVFSYAPDMGKARQAAANIKDLFERVPSIDTWSKLGDIPENVLGNIEFSNVVFRYPSRPEVPVLRGLNLSIKQGQYVALVGSSGCGKSTTIGLIESFYKPLSGQILLDGKDISEFNLSEYRKTMAIVQQEPILYALSVYDNIKLGVSHDVGDDEIIEACKQANIHEFISALPEGYNTQCGAKGVLFSGGQKQRIAIARALVRQPKILLLDEATSALDSESEEVVQEALDKAAKGRTTIAVTHRLSTIQNADVIYVIEHGKVIESGNHHELLLKQGRYYDLVLAQTL
ncbi:P-loop containing nucleoside triphosphate hydrolase protein [Dipodascopsis tothii]|uniref:P-loop containing nucleoside triphosphate hydrolase protein n=1 Tax=Dipodascopsis tothii TaxID=44089 RepID=UPI0034CDC136